MKVRHDQGQPQPPKHKGYCCTAVLLYRNPPVSKQGCLSRCAVIGVALSLLAACTLLVLLYCCCKQFVSNHDLPACVAVCLLCSSKSPNCKTQQTAVKKTDAFPPVQHVYDMTACHYRCLFVYYCCSNTAVPACCCDHARGGAFQSDAVLRSFCCTFIQQYTLLIDLPFFVYELVQH